MRPEDVNVSKATEDELYQRYKDTPIEEIDKLPSEILLPLFFNGVYQKIKAEQSNQ
jgi:hypothetical protein